MSRSDRDRLLDVLDAIAAIHRHLERGPLTDGLIFDAIQVRGSSRSARPSRTCPQPCSPSNHIPWRQVAAMPDQLAHRYFDTSHGIVQQTVDTDLDELATAVVAAYESAAREPSLATLAALVEATGIRLDLELGADLPSPRTYSGPIGHRLRRRRAAVLALAAHRWADLRCGTGQAHRDRRGH